MSYDEIYMEGYILGLEEAENYEYNSSSKSNSKSGGYKQSSISISSNNPKGLMAKYGKYVQKCQAKGKEPKSFESWCKTKAAIISGVTAGTVAGTAGGVALHKLRKNKKQAVNEAFADGYYAALCDIDQL